MNKLKRLQRRLVKAGAIVAGAIAAAAVVMVLAGNFADSAAKGKLAANGKLTQSQGQLSNLRSQLDRSGDAEKQFLIIQQGRPDTGYSANSDTLKELLRAAKEHYRFSDSFKLELATEKPSDRPEFSTLDYDVTVREPMKLSLEAISDMHVYAFLATLSNDAPGFVRITSLDLKRKGDMSGDAIGQMAGGGAPMLVDATVEFSWIGIAPKKKPADAPAANAAAANAGMP
ncbi:MAG: hypothetical protein WDN72_09765 [Alphaproteobacteria bacterium]